MKPSTFACAMLLAVLFCVVCCKKDPTKNAELPAATQEGRNTVGFTVDGEVWVPYYKCGFGSDPCGQISAKYDYPAAPRKGIGFGVTRQRGDRLSALSISSALIGTITSTGEKIDSIRVSFQSENSVGNAGLFLGPRLNRPKKFLITRFDSLNQIISGEFEFVLMEDNGSGKELTIKDGRFDLRFNACICTR